MPNWCNNTVNIWGEPLDIKKFKKKAFKTDKDGCEMFKFNNLLPRPKKEEENWYNWNNKNWGTKWDVNFDNDYVHDISNDDSIEIEFDTAWGPPVGVFNHIKSKFPNLQISWYYHEPGMELSGYLQEELQ